MGARAKLNEAYLIGSILLAAVVGGLAGSWTVFVVTFIVLLGSNLYSGDIRPGHRGR